MIERFVEQLRARLAKGAEEYGDTSFCRPPMDLLRELQEEALDLAGWGFVLYVRIEAMKAKARELDDGC